MRYILQSVLAAAMLVSIPTGASAATYHHPMFQPQKGGSICYYRVYSAAFLKKNPEVKLTTLSVERRNSISDVTANKKNRFGLKFGATTKSEDYTALAECKPQGSVISCAIESDGGTFTVQRAGKGLIIKTRRIEIEGVFKDLAIMSAKGKPTRSFTLKGSGKETCAAAFD